MVVSGYEHAFKVLDRIQCTMKIMAMIISKIIPGAWGALQSHDPQDPNQSQSKPKKVPVEGGPLVS